MNEIILAGCTPTSLASYLKAIGVLRLIAEQLDGAARAYWRTDHFVLVSRQSREEIEQFFLHSYKPTPIISPWSGRAGFLEGDVGDESTRKGAATLRAVSASTGGRFAQYRELIALVKEVNTIAELDQSRPVVKRLEGREKAGMLDKAGRDALKEARRTQKDLKDTLLVSLRSTLSDTFLPWFDACFVLAGGVATPAPLLGSGGNEGSMDFSVNHVATLLDLIDSGTDAPTPRSAPTLANALYGQTNWLDSTSNIGFLSVAAAGGANMSTGFTGASKENLWNCVLALEGAVLLAATATKKLESGDMAGLTFPFMVQATYAGDGAISPEERSGPEAWLPRWSQPASIPELRYLFSEGRSTLGSRQARNGLDMLEALSELGTDRGISAFERFGFFERRGKGYFVAGHLGSYKAPRERSVSFTDDLRRGRWLENFCRFAAGKNTANRFKVLRRKLEDQLFDLSNHEPNPAEIQSLLVLLGEMQHAMAKSTKARDEVAPIPRLSERWVLEADDGTPEFRIAKALAGLRGVGDVALPLRAQVFPVQRKFNQWMTAKADEAVRVHFGEQGRLTDLLASWLEHRLRLMQALEMTDKPLSSLAGARLDDVAAFIQNDRMDQRIAALLTGLCLCDIPQDTERDAGEGRLPAAFGLMKLALTSDRELRSLRHLAEDEHLPVPAGMVATLRAGNPGNRAVKLARRRLRASGLMPSLGDALPALAGTENARVAAALLIPLRWAALATLARTLLNEPESRAATVPSADRLEGEAHHDA